ncbi:type II toxin-antitoxin system RelE/ParE family toxin [Aeromonas dhakensis]|uniref:type II toxin-antitoxin system RelE/ParE family toxin n=1 Tax=Aeromonas dhakensis TaxID=196024 RepID=UPI0039875FA1
MSKINVCVSKPATREYAKLPQDAQKAFQTYVEETLKKGEFSSLESEKFKSIHSSVIEVKVKGRPASRMFYTTLLDGHIEVLAFATKSRNGQDPQIKATVEQRFKDFKKAYGVK